MKVLAISGSLRAASLNTMLLRAVSRLAPTGIEVCLYAGIGDLPLFNPDIEATDPEPVAELRESIISSDALVIASPEYAHGVTGVIKNSLDWMVGNESFVEKPVALFNASPRATHAQAALRETIATMSGNVVDAACITIAVLGSGVSEDDIVQVSSLSSPIIEALRELQSATSIKPAGENNFELAGRG